MVEINNSLVALFWVCTAFVLIVGFVVTYLLIKLTSLEKRVKTEIE